MITRFVLGSLSVFQSKSITYYYSWDSPRTKLVFLSFSLLSSPNFSFCVKEQIALLFSYIDSICPTICRVYLVIYHSANWKVHTPLRREKMDEMSSDSDWCLVPEIASKLPHNELEGGQKESSVALVSSSSASYYAEEKA